MQFLRDLCVGLIQMGMLENTDPTTRATVLYLADAKELPEDRVKNFLDKTLTSCKLDEFDLIELALHLEENIPLEKEIPFEYTYDRESYTFGNFLNMMEGNKQKIV